MNEEMKQKLDELTDRLTENKSPADSVPQFIGPDNRIRVTQSNPPQQIDYGCPTSGNKDKKIYGVRVVNGPCRETAQSILRGEIITLERCVNGFKELLGLLDNSSAAVEEVVYDLLMQRRQH